MRKEEQEADGIEVTWGELPATVRVSNELMTLTVTAEDQQHINTFSKYNARVGELQEELKERQVSHIHFRRQARSESTDMRTARVSLAR
jgi:hypothetical protein